jgi:hypothetical protein
MPNSKTASIGAFAVHRSRRRHRPHLPSRDAELFRSAACEALSRTEA